MKKNIHPTFYPDSQIICACGNTWITGSTKKVIRTEVCSKCHPFFTGQQQRLGTRANDALTKAGINTIGDVLERLSKGEASMLEIEGFGRKSLIDMKKSLRNLGYELPAAAQEPSV
jgi:large subunit ribosomal protein L31